MRTSKTIMQLLLCFAAAVFFTCSSCENKTEEQPATTVDTAMVEMDDDGDTDENENPISEFREALAALPAKDRIQTFSGMSPEFKAAIWRNRLSDALKMDLTEEQKGVLLKLTEQITPETYTEKGRVKYTAFLVDFKPMAMAAFKDDTVKLLTIVTQLDGAPQAPDTTAMPTKDCDCSVTSDLCAINHDCKPRTCNSSSWGCGWTQLYSCDGLCIYAP